MYKDAVFWLPAAVVERINVNVENTQFFFFKESKWQNALETELGSSRNSRKAWPMVVYLQFQKRLSCWYALFLLCS